ncbi:hypothetical protein D3P07_21075 [Paenibacillus sp. 1011MAR3C5]|uniref:hypothetical protein n=1 Tax=Paenibacillus sp. 1011MAR3C5 TaxID=1675787 RepID=UPI000E6C9352|nr:hypothetical protein [Paenibacillus sp. 1011MAR3C5]RJE85681.1 hypothetical protein D3P07_21075 [Paenibacillus sp. 1011MAR3C5]
MNQAGEDKKLRDQLHREMEPVVFSEEMQAAVLKRAAAPKPSWWNREIHIPAPVVTALLLLVIAVPVYGWQQAHSMQANVVADTSGKGSQQEERIIVSTAGVFYASQLEGEDR